MSSDAPGQPIEIKSCDDVLSHVFEFLDHETDDARRAVIAEHLEDCSSCLREFGIEQEFKALVRRRCGGDAPPPGLKDRIKLQLTSVSFEEDGVVGQPDVPCVALGLGEHRDRLHLQPGARRHDRAGGGPPPGHEHALDTQRHHERSLLRSPCRRFGRTAP